jgi:hypothetical protein
MQVTAPWVDKGHDPEKWSSFLLQLDDWMKESLGHDCGTALKFGVRAP